jgi:biotin-dependent carboxylase-like uncharacterized protein
MSAQFQIQSPGILSLLQDAGRYGQHTIGLTNGGPMDPLAYKWANRLLGNSDNATVIETTVGGLSLISHVNTQVAITGAKVSVKINGIPQAQWQTLAIAKNDVLELGYATQGCRIYIAVKGGFQVDKQFSSTSTVMREGVGGLSGKPLQKGDVIYVLDNTDDLANKTNRFLKLPENKQPKYSNDITLRVIPGYQEHEFSRHDQRMFFYHEYTVSDLCDRMGYRLSGEKVNCNIQGILSEGIALGAIQIPKDGQPIILMNDRQTIGGYPKIGSVLSLDLAKLAQLTQGGKVRFEPITIDHAHSLLLLAQHQFENTFLETIKVEPIKVDPINAKSGQSI